MVRCAVESGSGAQQESELSEMTGCPISHTESATGIKLNDRASHQLYRERLVEGTRRALRSSRPQASTKPKVKVNVKIRDDARGVAWNDIKDDAGMRRRGRHQPKYQQGRLPDTHR